MKQILVIRDPDYEVGFDVVCEFARSVALRLKDEPVLVLPMWPHGKVELIGDKRKMKLIVKEYKELLAEMEEMLEEKEGDDQGDTVLC